MNSKCWLQISSGNGPEECCCAVGKVYGEIKAGAGKKGISVSLIHAIPSQVKGNFKSLLLSLAGAGRERSNGYGKANTVRIIHLSTGITVQASEERSQHMNKKLVLARLDAILRQRHQKRQIDHSKERWHKHHQLVRGSSIRVYNSTLLLQLPLAPSPQAAATIIFFVSLFIRQ